jgi:hypothetical protein
MRPLFDGCSNRTRLYRLRQASIRAIYEHIRDSRVPWWIQYGSDFLRIGPRGDYFSWEWAYDVLMSLEKKRAIDFLFLLRRADPPVISFSSQQFFRDAVRENGGAPKPDKRAEARRNAFEWMRSVLQRDGRQGGLP